MIPTTTEQANRTVVPITGIGNEGRSEDSRCACAADDKLHITVNFRHSNNTSKPTVVGDAGSGITGGLHNYNERFALMHSTGHDLSHSAASRTTVTRTSPDTPFCLTGRRAVRRSDSNNQESDDVYGTHSLLYSGVLHYGLTRSPDRGENSGTDRGRSHRGPDRAYGTHQ